MIIDFHTHTFPDTLAPRAVAKLSEASHTVAFTDATESALRRSMRDAGVDLCVVLPVATNPAKVVEVNDASRHLDGSQGLVSFACMHPAFDGWKEEMARVARLGFCGIKLHPEYQQTDFDDVSVLRILDRAAELGLCVVTHAGKDIAFTETDRASPKIVKNALRQTDGVTLVLAHMGGWRDWDEIDDTLCGENVYIDTAFSLGRLTPTAPGYHDGDEGRLLNTESAMRLIRLFGVDHVLFGTDSPWSCQKETRRLVESLPLTDAEKQAVMGDNARRLLKL